MGYTHYFKITEIPLVKWKQIVRKCKRIAMNAKCPLQEDYDDANKPPLLDDEVILFNGTGDDAYEDFLLERIPYEEFNFCKTARKPYDRYVVACLRAAKKIAPECITLSSDGGYEVFKDEPQAH